MGALGPVVTAGQQKRITHANIPSEERCSSGGGCTWSTRWAGNLWTLHSTLLRTLECSVETKPS